MKKLISYIFPVFNEEGNIERLFRVITSTVNDYKDKYDFEFICVNDGSKDGSLDKLLELPKRDNRFKVINFSRNFGHQIAVTAGLDYAKGEAVIIMDSDLQDPAEVSLQLIDKWEEGYEVVYAQRRKRKDTAFKRLTAFMFYRFLERLSEVKIPKDTGDFRLMDRKVVEAVKSFREQNRFLRGIVAYVGFKQIGVLFDREERYSGKTHYPLKKMLKLAFDGIASFSTLPLKLLTQAGIILSSLGLLIFLLGIILSVFNISEVSTTYFLISIIVLIGGIQLAGMGILGSYIGRIHSQVMGRPLYIVSSIYEEK